MMLEYSLELGIDYRDVNTITEYNVSNQDIMLTFENRLINDYVGAEVGVSVIQDSDKQMSGLFLISLEF